MHECQHPHKGLDFETKRGAAVSIPGGNYEIHLWQSILFVSSSTWQHGMKSIRKGNIRIQLSDGTRGSGSGLLKRCRHAIAPIQVGHSSQICAERSYAGWVEGEYASWTFGEAKGCVCSQRRSRGDAMVSRGY